MKQNLNEPLLKTPVNSYGAVQKLNNSSFMDQIMRIKPNKESLIRAKGQAKTKQKIQYERTLTLSNLVRIKFTDLYIC
jgi:hypothetical protein